MALITPTGHCEYRVMPFGLINTQAVFQHFIKVLREALGHYAYVYLNDILIYSRSLQEHVRHVRSILQLLLENRLYLKLEKFGVPCLYGILFGLCGVKGTLRMDVAKIRAMEDSFYLPLVGPTFPGV